MSKIRADGDSAFSGSLLATSFGPNKKCIVVLVVLTLIYEEKWTLEIYLFADKSFLKKIWSGGEGIRENRALHKGLAGRHP